MISKVAENLKEGSSRIFGTRTAKALEMASFSVNCYIKNEIDGSWK